MNATKTAALCLALFLTLLAVKWFSPIRGIPGRLSLSFGSSSPSSEPEDDGILSDVSSIGEAESNHAQCQLPQTSNFSEMIRPIVRHETKSYVIPRSPSKRALLSERLLDEETVFAFIHINKAGGTLVKEELFRPVAKERRWSGEGWGSAIGWKQLLRPCIRGSNAFIAIDEALNCGETANLSPCGPVGAVSCPVRLVWGTHAMGMCQLYTKPCVMTVVLRDPVERVISQYNYVCVEGREEQKKWLPEWREQGRCPLSLLQFLDTELTSQTFLIDHLARAADPSCGVNLALQNLFHPCVRFLLLDKLSDGLSRLSKVWGPAMRPQLEKLALKANEKRNHAPYEARVKVQMDDPIVQERLKAALKMDIEFYRRAREFYEQQWNRPLESCNGIGD